MAESSDKERNPLIEQWLKNKEPYGNKVALRFGAITGDVLIVADNDQALRDFCLLFPAPVQDTIN